MRIAGPTVLIAALGALHVIGAKADDSSAPRNVRIAQGTGRQALVIGNAAYQSSPLRNPTNDAADVASALRQRGFEVTCLTNAGKKDITDAIRRFGGGLHRSSVSLFYYSGHGMQVDGRNYLIPVDADIEAETEVEYEAVDIGRLLSGMEDASKTSTDRVQIVILDACRDNPFARSFRSISAGLARMDAPRGTIVSYATGPNQVAADGSGRNGLYTAALLEEMTVPGLQIEDVFKQVRARVLKASGNRQMPWESTCLVGRFCFTDPAAPPPVASPVTQPPAG